MLENSLNIRQLGFALIDSVLTQPNEATKRIEEFQDIVGENPSPDARSLLYLARATQSFSNSESLGVSLALRAYEFARKAADASVLIKCVSTLGTFHFRKQEFPEALEYFQDAEEYLTTDVQGFNRFAVFYNIGETHRILSNFEQALAYFKRAESMDIEEVGNEAFSALYNNLGNLYAHASVSAEALLYFNRAADCAKLAGSDIDLSRAAVNSADAYVQLNAFEQALTMAELALSLKEKVGDHVGKGYVYMTLAKMHIKRKEYDAAHRLLDQAKQAFDTESGMTNRKASCTFLKAELLFEENKLTEAMRQYKAAESMHALASNSMWVLRCQLGQAKVWKAQGDIHRAEVMLKRHSTNVAGEGSREIKQIIASEMADLYEAELDYKRAYTELRQYNEQRYSNMKRDAVFVDNSRNTMLKMARLERNLNTTTHLAGTTSAQAEMELLEHVFQMMPYPVWLTTGEGDSLVFQFANIAFENATGLPRKRIVGKKLGRLLPKSTVPRMMRHARQAIQSCEVKVASEVIESPNGERDYTTILVPIRIAEKVHLLCLADDTTERKNRQRSLNRATQIKVREIRSLQKFVASVSHELRTHITTLLGYTELAMLEHEGLPVLKNVRSASRDILSLVQAMSLLSDDRRLSHRIEATEFSVRVAIQEELHMLASDKSINVQCDEQEDVHIFNAETEIRKLVSLLVRLLSLADSVVQVTMNNTKDSYTVVISSDWSDLKASLARPTLQAVSRVMDALGGSAELNITDRVLTFTLEFRSIDNNCFR